MAASAGNPAEHSRMQIFDTVRGLSIILVVLGHVLLYMNLGMNHTLLSRTLITFRMPLFFFVSGFFAFRAAEKWTGAIVRDIVLRKIRAQIICTFIFYSAFQLTVGQSVMAWVHGGFGGYWFTIVLFQIFMIFLCLSVIGKFWGGTRFVLISMVILSCVTAFYSSRILHYNAPTIGINSTVQLTQYFQFFTLGLIARHYSDAFVKLLNANWFRTVVIVGFFACMFCVVSPLRVFFSYWVRDFLVDFPSRYFGLFALLVLFFAKRDYFERRSGVPAILSVIGRRTLDIYMLHYFFLPKMPYMAQYIGAPSMIIVQLAVSGALAIMIVAICMVISNLLRSSHFLAVWLFGIRPSASA